MAPGKVRPFVAVFRLKLYLYFQKLLLELIINKADIIIHKDFGYIKDIGFLSPMHKKIPDSYSKREGGNPGNSGLSSQQ